jgi:hypothetical protein
MKYLVDSSVWLEILLQQDGEPKASEFLTAVSLGEVGVTDFAMFSIALKLLRHERSLQLEQFGRDLDQSVRVVRVPSRQFADVTRTMKAYRLDFDDAYQYVAAEQNDLTLVSLDRHFTRTPRGCRSPTEILLTLRGES